MSEDVVLNLNLSRDTVALSIAYVYLHAHGIDATAGLAIEEIAALAQELSDERVAQQLVGATSDFYTAAQTWPMCKSTAQPLGHDVDNATLKDLEVCLGIMGLRVAGVALRTIPEDEHEAYGDALHRLRERSEVLME